MCRVLGYWGVVLLFVWPVTAYGWGWHGRTAVRTAYYYPVPVFAAPVYVPAVAVPAPVYVPPPAAVPAPLYAPAIVPADACPAPAPPSGVIAVPAAPVPTPPAAAVPQAVSPGTPTSPPGPTAPATPAPPSTGPVTSESSRKAVENSGPSYFDTYTLARSPDRPAGERCRVSFWNLAGRPLTLKVDGRSVVLETSRKMTFDLGHHFVWRVDDRDPRNENVPAEESGVEIVVRR